MNTISTLKAAQGDEQVAAQELELKGLLVRVMEAPLTPVVQHLGRIEERLDELEEMCCESRDLANGVQADIAKHKDAAERSLRSLEKSIGAVRISLDTGLAGISGSVAQLGKALGDVDRQLGQVHQTQQAQDGTLKEFSSAIDAINEGLKRTAMRIDAVVPAQQGSARQLKEELLQSHAQHGDRLDRMLYDGLAGISGAVGQLCKALGDVDEQLGQVHQLQQAQDGTLKEFSLAFGAIDEGLKHTAISIHTVIPAQQGSAQQLKEELLQSHAQHGDRLESMHQTFQRKFTLLTLACGFSVFANILLLVAFLR